MTSLYIHLRGGQTLALMVLDEEATVLLHKFRSGTASGLEYVAGASGEMIVRRNDVCFSWEQVAAIEVQYSNPNYRQKPVTVKVQL